MLQLEYVMFFLCCCFYLNIPTCIWRSRCYCGDMHTDLKSLGTPLGMVGRSVLLTQRLFSAMYTAESNLVVC